MTRSEWIQRFTQNMRVRRAVLNITQTEVAKRLRVTPQQVQKWEAGTIMPSGWAIQRLAEALDCKSTNLIPTDDEEEDRAA